MLDTILGAKCRLVEIYINDRPVFFDDLCSIEWKYDFFNPIIYGALCMRDTYNLTNSKSVKIEGASKLKIILIDKLGAQYIKNFTIINTPRKVEDHNPKVYLTFIDDISYRLINSTSSSVKSSSIKGLDVMNIVRVFAATCGSLGIKELLENDKLNIDFDDKLTLSNSTIKYIKDNVSGLNIPNSINILDFFFKECQKYNVRFWQDHRKFYCKQFNLNDLQIGYKQIKNDKNQYIPIVYTNDNLNYDCIYHIHEYKIKSFADKTRAIEQKKIARMVGKNIYLDNVDLSDFCKSLVMNGNDTFKQVQPTSRSFDTDINNTVEKQKYDLFNNYIQSNKIQIFVEGNINELNIGKKYLLKFKDESQFSEHQGMGDITLSGYYLSSEITHKLIGDKLIDRVTMVRFDNPKSIKL